MTTTTLNPGDHGCYQQTLAAGVVDTVQFATQEPIEVSTDGSAAVYFTVDGSTPTVAGHSTFQVPAGQPASRQVSGVVVGEQTGTVVKLISTGTPVYSVTVVQS